MDKYKLIDGPDGSTAIEIQEFRNDMGEIIFCNSLIVGVAIDKDNDLADIYYDFVMTDTISLSKSKNFLYNYNNDNPLGEDVIKTAIATIKFDIMHAFFHSCEDPNYTFKHWALYGNLKDRVKLIEQ